MKSDAIFSEKAYKPIAENANDDGKISIFNINLSKYWIAKSPNPAIINGKPYLESLLKILKSNDFIFMKFGNVKIEYIKVDAEENDFANNKFCVVMFFVISKIKKIKFNNVKSKIFTFANLSDWS